jgi:hypothetical protein
VSNLSFDTYQFENRANHPVHADFDGHDFHSNGVAFEDYARMHTETHKLAAWRPSIPDWVFNDSKLRAVIVGCVEARARNGTERIDRTGTHAERLARAQKKLAEDRPNLEARIDNLCAKYVAAKRAGDAVLTRHFGQKIEEVDTQLRMIDSRVNYYAGVAYHCWRCGVDSVAAASRLGIKPPHVRALMWRMSKVAGELGYGPPKTIKQGRNKNM